MNFLLAQIGLMAYIIGFCFALEPADKIRERYGEKAMILYAFVICSIFLAILYVPEAIFGLWS